MDFYSEATINMILGLEDISEIKISMKNKLFIFKYFHRISREKITNRSLSLLENIEEGIEVFKKDFPNYKKNDMEKFVMKCFLFYFKEDN